MEGRGRGFAHFRSKRITYLVIRSENANPNCGDYCGEMRNRLLWPTPNKLRELHFLYAECSFSIIALK